MNRRQLLGLIPASLIPYHLSRTTVSAAPKRAVFEFLEIRGAEFVHPTGINNHGDICGYLRPGGGIFVPDAPAVPFSGRQEN